MIFGEENDMKRLLPLLLCLTLLAAPALMLLLSYYSYRSWLPVQYVLTIIAALGSTLSSEGQTAMTFVGAGLSLASIVTSFLLWSSR